jgi:hypothetical protein
MYRIGIGQLAPAIYLFNEKDLPNLLRCLVDVNKANEDNSDMQDVPRRSR